MSGYRKKRHRMRASDIAPRQRRSLLPLILVAFALTAVIAYKVTLGEETAGFFETLTKGLEGSSGNTQDLDLPPSVTDRADGGPASQAPQRDY